MTNPLRIAFLGSRGIPARYSGFETFYEQLATRLAARGHAVTVYNRAHFIRDVRGEYRGVRLVTLPSIPTKHLDTITHTALSSLHALSQGYDIVYYCIVGNSPLVWLPRMTGARTLLNVDGQDWAREKWSGFARWYQRWCERVATKTAGVIIADAQVVRNRYRELYGAESVYAPYGGNIRRNDATATLTRWGLTPRRYVLFVGRLVPENCADLLIRAFRALPTDMKLVIVGDAPFSESYKGSLAALADDRVVFTGYAFGDAYEQLSSHAYLYVQPSGVQGTRPALLDQLGFGNCVLVRDSEANLEVIGDCGCSFDRSLGAEGLTRTLAALLADGARVESFRDRAHRRISEWYNWDWICDYYEQLFQGLLSGQPAKSYDEYLSASR
jgi:glycosyltransferase involved in cell wall biosynthesis